MRRSFARAAILLASLSCAAADDATPNSEATLGGLDYSAGGGYRTTPLGAALALEAGYGWAAWDKRQDAPFMYGYLRPWARLQSSGVVNRGEAGLDLFPISIWGITLEQAYVSRNTDLGTLDCATMECHGVLARKILSTQLLLGYDRYFFASGMRFEWLTPPNQTGAFGDEGSNLEGKAGGDRLMGLKLLAGAKISDDDSAGVLVDSSNMRGTRKFNVYNLFFWRHKFGAYTLTGSGGSYHSSTHMTSPTVALSFGWTGLPSIALH